MSKAASAGLKVGQKAPDFTVLNRCQAFAGHGPRPVRWQGRGARHGRGSRGADHHQNVRTQGKEGRVVLLP